VKQHKENIMAVKSGITLYIDQYGDKWYANTVKSLCKQIGRSKARRMYIDKKDGSTKHIGYVVGNLWCTAYKPVEMDFTQ
jgi:hypothetical protein